MTKRQSGIKFRFASGLLLLAWVIAAATTAQAADLADVTVVRGSTRVTESGSGATITFVGNGFRPSSPVRISIDGQPRRQATSAASGDVFARIPLSVEGRHLVAAVGTGRRGGLLVVTGEVTLAAGSTSVLSPHPPRASGALHVYLALACGFGVVATGILILFSMRVLSRMPLTR
jgi:hypothetical protein